MSFAHPLVLWLLAVAIPGLAVFFVLSWRTRRRLIAQFVPARLQSTLTLGLSPRRARTRALLLLAALAALLVALARPRYGAGIVEVSQRGLDILVAIDTSRSMLAEDAGPGISRLQRAKLAALDLARATTSDRIGLIAFAGTAFLQCPLTIDAEAFRQSVEDLDTDIIPHGGSSLAAAIRIALEASANDPSNVPVLVLLTDGEEHEAGALEAADRAQRAGLRIFTLGIGTARGEIIRLPDSSGNLAYLKDNDGNVVKSSLNESLLQEVAERTGGLYLPLQGPRLMAELYERGLAPLPRADLAARRMEQFHERFQWPLAFALLLLALEALLPERGTVRGRARPVRLAHPTLAGTATAPAILILALALLAPPRAAASSRSALGDYQAGKYEAALDEFERLSRERPDDARLRFNAGTAAYRAGQFDRAARHFAEALRSPDLALQQDAFYNLGNAQFTQGEEAPDPDARARLWERSIESFEAALNLGPQHTNAHHNLEYVRQRLEQLQQQQQQQQQQGGSQQEQEHQDQESSSDPNASPNPQEDGNRNPSPNQEPPPEDAADNRSSPSPEEADDKPQDDQAPQDRPSSGEDSKTQGSESPEPRQDGREKPGETSPSSPNSGDTAAPDASQAGERPDRMTPQQALRLLDTARAEEKPIPLQKRRARTRVLKDW